MHTHWNIGSAARCSLCAGRFLSRAELNEAENSVASARIHDPARYPRFSDHLHDDSPRIHVVHVHHDRKSIEFSASKIVYTYLLQKLRFNFDSTCEIDHRIISNR